MSRRPLYYIARAPGILGHSLCTRPAVAAAIAAVRVHRQGLNDELADRVRRRRQRERELLVAAVGGSDAPRLRRLIEFGLDLNQIMTPRQSTPLMLAADLTTATLLLQHGAKVGRLTVLAWWWWW